MGTFNTGKSDLGITVIYDSGCIDNYNYDDEEALYNDVENEIKEISSWDNIFPYDVYHSLSDIFKIKIEPGYYDGFYIYIDSHFSINYMIEEIKSGLYRPSFDINKLDNEDIKLETFFQYIADDIASDIVGSTPEMIKDIKNIVKEYFYYLNYNIAKIGKIYGLYNLVRNGWIRNIEHINDNIINKFERKIS